MAINWVSLSAITQALGTIVLVGITWRYVRMTGDVARLSRAQLEELRLRREVNLVAERSADRIYVRNEGGTAALEVELDPAPRVQGRPVVLSARAVSDTPH